VPQASIPRCMPSASLHQTPTCAWVRCTLGSGSCWGVCQMLLCRRRCTHLHMTTANRNAAAVGIGPCVCVSGWTTQQHSPLHACQLCV
jgi:hypothetical protein